MMTSSTMLLSVVGGYHIIRKHKSLQVAGLTCPELCNMPLPAFQNFTRKVESLYTNVCCPPFHQSTLSHTDDIADVEQCRYFMKVTTSTAGQDWYIFEDFPVHDPSTIQ